MESQTLTMAGSNARPHVAGLEPANQPAFAEAKLQLRAGRPRRVSAYAKASADNTIILTRRSFSEGGGAAKDSSLGMAGFNPAMRARELDGRIKSAHGELMAFDCVNSI
jgi:hypothetical protein